MNVVTVCFLAWVSFYVPSLGGTNCGAACGITFSGVPPGPKIAACGPAWPLGTRLYVPGKKYGDPGYEVTCGDRFGEPPDPYAVDLFAPDLATAVRGGGHWTGPVCRIQYCRQCAD